MEKRQWIKEVIDRLNQGVSMSEALQKASESFPENREFLESMAQLVTSGRSMCEISDRFPAVFTAAENKSFCSSKQSSVEEQFLSAFQKIEHSKENGPQETVNHWLKLALEMEASDIHCLPGREGVKISFRVDGRLKFIEMVEHAHYELCVARLKSMSALDTTLAKQRPQDGRILIRIGDKEVDLLVATMPVIFGEKITVRILRPQSMILSLDKIMNPQDKEIFEGILGHSYGMILFCGVTGSGKTTTMYAAMNHLADSGERACHSVENPVELYLPNVASMALNAQNGITHTSALRSVMRHDPDVVMVGEIPDKEVMDVCLDIARTGHFLLSSFHTPDCEETLRYLQELSSDSMVLSTVIAGIVCQRLLRKVCPHCSKLEKLGAAAADLPGVDSSCEVPVACGCEHCNDTGYRGRIAVYEFFTPDRVKRGLIREKNEKKLNKFFKSEEFEGLKQKAIKEMLAGKTTLEEIQWVFPEDFSC